jgi:hypothetical protein
MLYNPNVLSSTTRSRGRRRSKGQRAGVAAQWILGERPPIKPTIQVAAAANGVSTTYVKTALKVTAAERAELVAGTVEIVEFLPERKSPSSLSEHFISSTAEEKVEAAKALGVDVVWDQMVLPLIGPAE